MMTTALEADNTDNQLSTHRRAPQYSFQQDSRFLTRSSSQAAPGPGYYKVDRDFVMRHEDEMTAGHITGPHGTLQKGVAFTTEARTTADGTLKGMASPDTGAGRSSLGPGYYESHLVSASKSILYSIPAAKESAEALRERKQYGHAIGPGAYEKHGIFDGIGQERQKALKRLARRHGQGCWASQQYSHIFGCMKPIQRSSSERGLARATR
mmetsp:Transcript_55/g.69  ORF Transcript_55/g.69 Transcript_55/m.69 type:complete len:210 (-) Transcript_55:107-736(-)